MGEIADMMLEGILDEETGEYIGDQNEAIYGVPNPGFPISYERDGREGTKLKISCPTCGKMVKPVGLSQHQKDKHGLTNPNEE